MALHTIQDYFAHVIRAKIKHTYYCNNPYLPSNECIKETPYKEYFMYQIDDIMGLPNSAIEDNIKVFNWRYNTASKITKIIYNQFWLKNKLIHKISVSKLNTFELYIKYVGRTKYTIMCNKHKYTLK